MRSPLVSIVTPSYNQGSFIRATIESVLSQDHPDIEYIVMDGGSTDETASVVKDYSSRLIWISEKDRGQSHAINKGFQMAKGSVVAWLNSDDVYLPGAVARGTAELVANPRFGAVYGEGYLIDRAGKITKRFPVTEPFNLWKLVHLSDYVLQQTVFFRRSVFDEIGWVDEDLHYVMDWDLLIRIGKRYPLGYIPEYLACLREYPEAKTFVGGRQRVAEIGEIMRRHAGKRVTPGYIVYALDAYRKIWCKAIEKRTPRWLRWPSRKLERVVDLACLVLIGHQITHAQGFYRDRWAGKRMRWMEPAGGDRVAISGFNPSRRRSGLRLDVSIDGEWQGTQSIEPGEFRLEYTVAGGGRDRMIELVAHGYHHRARRPDRLRRYYRLSAVDVSGARTERVTGHTARERAVPAAG